MTSICDLRLFVRTGRRVTSHCQNLADDDEDIDWDDWRMLRRWRELEDDDPYEPPEDEDDDYEDFRWEEVPGEGTTSPPEQG